MNTTNVTINMVADVSEYVEAAKLFKRFSDRSPRAAKIVERFINLSPKITCVDLKRTSASSFCYAVCFKPSFSLAFFIGWVVQR
ncbi:MAG: hypothetical protein LBE75_09845 [Burkholderiales bacterium]|jgi:hypothetical protein|nr:hypothetical protein [Burkholderiales bacterium]